MYMFPSASSATSVGPHKPADVAGPPSPSCCPPSPATVLRVGAFSADPPPPQAVSTPNTDSNIPTPRVNLINDAGRCIPYPSPRPTFMLRMQPTARDRAVHHSNDVFITKRHCLASQAKEVQLLRTPCLR